MKAIATWFLGCSLICAVAHGQQTPAKQPRIDLAKIHDSLPDKEFTAKAADTSFVARGGERVLRQEIVLPATVEQVWEAVSTSAGLRGWVAPVAEVELTTGGHYYTNYRVGSKIGDPGTIYNSVLAYVPGEMLAIHVKLATPLFPESVVQADRLSAILQIHKLDDAHVRVSETMVGWQSGADWDQVYKFFQTGNAYTLGQLLKRFTIGPREWK